MARAASRETGVAKNPESVAQAAPEAQQQQKILNSFKGVATAAHGKKSRVLFDTCASGTVGAPDVGANEVWVAADAESRPCISATGDAVGIQGKKNITLRSPDGGIIRVLADISEKDLSPSGSLVVAAGDMIARKHRAILDDETGSLLINKVTGECVRLVKKDNIYEIDVEIVDGTSDVAKDRHLNPMSHGGSSSSNFWGESVGGAHRFQPDGAAETESREAKVEKLPRGPRDAEEVERHRVLHYPHRDWCSHCVGARGRAERHLRNFEESGKPRAHFDYLFAGLPADERPLTGLMFFEEESGRIACTLTPSKSTTHPYCSKWCVTQFEMCGYADIVRKSDQERTLEALLTEASASCRAGGIHVVPENSMAYNPQTNGLIEVMNQVFKGTLRAHKSQLDANFAYEVPSDHPVMAWLVMHVGVILTLTRVRPDGKTAYEFLRGHRFGRRLYQIGEQIMFKPYRKDDGRGRVVQKKGALEQVWKEGMYLGIMERTGENIVMPMNGYVVKCRDVKRNPEGDRFCRKALDLLKGLPWQPRLDDGENVEPAGRSRKIDVAPGGEESVGVQAPIPRRFYVTEALLELYGRSRDCPRCQGSMKAAHTEACRRRILERVFADPEMKEKYDRRQTVEAEYERSGMQPDAAAAAEANVKRAKTGGGGVDRSSAHRAGEADAGEKGSVAQAASATGVAQEAAPVSTGESAQPRPGSVEANTASPDNIEMRS